MDTHESRSEIARLRERLALEDQAAHLALHGLAAGVTRHDFITKRMERLGAYLEALKPVVGEQEAARMIIMAMDELIEEK